MDGSDNTITLIETLTPNKTEALPYINAQSGNKKRTHLDVSHLNARAPSAPSTYARVILFCGASSIPVIKELMVGPLPISSNTTYQPLSYPYQNSSVLGVDGLCVFPFNARYPASIEIAALDGTCRCNYLDTLTSLNYPSLEFILSWTTKIANATLDLLGGAYIGADDDLLTYSYQV